MADKPVPAKAKSLMGRKIAGVPMPVALIALAIVGFLVYKHYKASGASTAGTSTSSATPDPNAIDPATGLTYGQEEQAGLGQIAGSPTGTGTGSGGVGSGLSVSDLEGLLQAFQGLGTNSYYYGYGTSTPTPTNPTGAGAGALSQTAPVAFGQTSQLSPFNGVDTPQGNTNGLSTTSTPTPEAAPLPDLFAQTPIYTPQNYTPTPAEAAEPIAGPQGGQLYYGGNANPDLAGPVGGVLVYNGAQGNFVSTPTTPVNAAKQVGLTAQAVTQQNKASVAKQGRLG